MKRNLWLIFGLIIATVFVFQTACTISGALTTSREGANTPLVAGAAQILPTAQQTGISVSGVGEVSVTPDVAIARIGVESKAVTVEKARSQAAAAMEAVMKVLTSNGVAQKDIKTQQFSISPVVRVKDREQINDGFQVTNIVTAKIRKVDDAGKILDAVTAAGGDLTRVQGISFTVDDPLPFQRQAREKAMADAKNKAEQLAALAGVKLGKPLSISEGVVSIPRAAAQASLSMGAGGETTPISPGEMDIRLNVQVVYAME